MSQFIYEKGDQGLSEQELRSALLESLEGRTLRKVLILPPDFTRFYSNGGLITNLYYHILKDRGCQVDIMPALGTHAPVSREEAEMMFGDIPHEELIPHNWRTDVVKIGEVPGDFLAEKTGGLWTESVEVEVNKRLMDPSYDLILSVGQVVPHVIVGMGNHAKNLFVGAGGSDMISKSHMIGAINGVDNNLGRDKTPVRELFDYAYEHFLYERPILYVLTVCTAPENKIRQHGLFIGHGRDVFEAGVALAQIHNVTHLNKPLKKCVAYLDPLEFKSTWVGTKALYRTCMAMEPGGELLILAPGVHTFGEAPEVDVILRKYGYSGQENLMKHYHDPEDSTLRDNLAAVSHLLLGSVAHGKFKVTWAVQKDFMQDVLDIGYGAADYEETARRYDPAKLRYGEQTLEDGEEIFYIPTPAIGLWINDGK